MAKLRSLWRGETPLGEAFWTWTVVTGLIVNVTTSVLFLTMIMLDRPLIALVFGYAVSIPYNIIAVVGVWRSAAHYEGPASHADLARGASLILMTFLTIL